MKKVALVFVLAVVLPSLVLAWLAVRSLRDQQFLLERQQSLLDQSVTDKIAQNISDHLAQQEHEFSAQVENLVEGQNPREVAVQFDQKIRRRWPLTEVGFCVTLSGKVICPSPSAGPAAQQFLADNSGFLGNREIAEVYLNNNVGNQLVNGLSKAPAFRTSFPHTSNGMTNATRLQNSFSNFKSLQSRSVSPQQMTDNPAPDKSKNTADPQNFSKVVLAEAAFVQLIGADKDGMFARFLQNRLQLMFWHRLNSEPDLVFGAELNLNRLVNDLRSLVQSSAGSKNEICVALLDDTAKPVAVSRANFSANWKHPFVATEIGDALPHWEVAAYLVDPVALTRAVCIANIAFGLLIVALVLVIVAGSWLIVKNLNAEVLLAWQKTDFVSSVSHELKTPLTSIRMFSELLAGQRVTDTAKQQSYLNIITAEAGRLTRLINNVLDFSRMERGEKKYNYQPCDLTEIARATAETFRPHFEAGGFKFDCELPDAKIAIRGDADALSQVMVNLLSNAEKYSNGAKEITLQLTQRQSPLPHAEIKVQDRGAGIPGGSEEKIFEKFYRAHDSLSSGVQGSGLGLTIARQIARAHGGDVVCEARDGGGSCFILRLPIAGSSRCEEAQIE
jgi:signal transduction histidine kinase